MAEALWNHGDDDEVTLVAGIAGIVWLDLASPFGDAPLGVDWTIDLPKGVRVLDLGRRPRLGCGPDAHRPRAVLAGQRLDLGFPGYLPADNHRRPMTHHHTWADLHFPLVLVADADADGGEIVIQRRAMGDHDERRHVLAVLDDPGIRPPPKERRSVQPTFLPWFSPEEQEAIATALRRCGITDVNLNWFTYGMPLLPPTVWRESVRILKRVIPGVTVWIGGMPGADTALPRAEGAWGRHIPFIASPEAAIAHGADLVVASERTWIETTGADGVMITLHAPGVEDRDPMPAWCFSAASRRRFAREAGLESVPDPMAIIGRHREPWLGFCCRQLRRLIEVAHQGHGDRPLALCLIGRGEGAARDEWLALGDEADLVIRLHDRDDESSRAGASRRWGLTRLGGMPQAWWEAWNERLAAIEDPAFAVADMKMQLALSGGAGVRLWSYDRADGHLVHNLMEWR